MQTAFKIINSHDSAKRHNTRLSESQANWAKSQSRMSVDCCVCIFFHECAFWWGWWRGQKGGLRTLRGASRRSDDLWQCSHHFSFCCGCACIYFIYLFFFFFIVTYYKYIHLLFRVQSQKHIVKTVCVFAVEKFLFITKLQANKSGSLNRLLKEHKET